LEILEKDAAQGLQVRELIYFITVF